MALCQLCESPRAQVTDVERLKPGELEDPFVRLLAELGVRPAVIQRALIECPDCGRRYRMIRLPVDEGFSKRYLRSGS